MDIREHEQWWSERGAGELRELLFREWDPIGLKDLAEGQEDEYEHYAGQLVRRLRAGADADELAVVLEGFRADMGVEPAPEDSLRAATRVREWYAASTSP
jgi:hypothetical protein